MSNTNTLHGFEVEHPKHNRKKFGYVAMLAGLLNLHTPANAQSNVSVDKNENHTELIDSKKESVDFGGQGLKLPESYKNKIHNMLAHNPVFIDDGYSDTKMFTIEFVLKEMESDRGISKENQLLFIWHSIYQQVTKKDLYDREDGDEKRLQEFEDAIDSIDMCGPRYKSEYMAYMDKLSAKERQRTVKSLNNSLNILKEYYGLYKQSPDVEEFKKFKLKLEEIIPLCKEYNVDYKAILSPDVCKFYGIE